MLIRLENIVVAPGKHDLTGLGADSVEVSGGDALPIKVRTSVISEESLINQVKWELFSHCDFVTQ